MATRTAIPRTGRGTGSNARSNPAPSGISQGTPGGSGRTSAATRMAGVSDEVYLWALLGLEAGAIVWLRKSFRRHHGG